MIQYGSPKTPGSSSNKVNDDEPNGFVVQPKNQPSPGKLKVPQKDLLVFFRQLSVVLESGVALAQGMILIAENMTNVKLAYCIQTIAFRLNAGEELSSSLRRYPKVFNSKLKKLKIVYKTIKINFLHILLWGCNYKSNYDPHTLRPCVARWAKTCVV